MANWEKLTDLVLENAICAFYTDAIHYPRDGSASQAVKVIFDNEFEQVDPDTENLIASQSPRAGVKISDFDNPIRKRDIFEIKGIEYEVIDKQEDGQGGATLFFHEV